MNGTWTKVAVTTALAGVFSASAAAGSVAQRPLFLGGVAEPNIMFLLDSSASMNNIVPDAPFDDTVTPCDDSNKLTLVGDEIVEVRIDSSGQASFSVVLTQNGSVVSTTNYAWGNASTAKCFGNGDADIYKATLNASDTSSRPWKPGLYLPAEYSGRYLNWYFSGSNNWGTSATRKPGTQTRAEIAQEALVNLLPSMEGTRVGLATYNGGDGAMIRAAVAPVTSSATLSLTSAINNVSFNGSTPLAESLHQIGHYFIGNTGTASGSSSDPFCTVNGEYTGDLLIHPLDSNLRASVSVSSLFPTPPAYPAGVAALESPICYSCQQNFAIVVTDGRATADDNIPSALRDYDGDCSGSNVSNCEDSDLSDAVVTPLLDRKAGASYAYESPTNGGSDYLDDVAQVLHEIDLRPDIAALNNLTTYVIGFADDQVLNDQLLKDAAAQGGGEFLTASNAGELIAKFQQAVGSIAAQVSSGTAIATTATELKTDLLAFIARFNTGDWTGELLARPVASNGSLSAVVWNAADSTSIPAHGSRGIYSWDPSSQAGFAFTAGNEALISAIAVSAGATSLTAAEIDYLRGDQSNELPGGQLGFRKRSKLLGDIINSDPLFVTSTNFGFARLPEGAADATHSYSSFLDGLSAPDMIYVGANDGMLHGYSISYDATHNTAGGIERFGFIPTAVYGGLASLASPSYEHRYYVDGAPTFSHAYIDPAAKGGSKSWRSVLTGTTGAGGSGVFALDITDPASFSAGNVLWDINANTDPVFADLGFTVGQVSIARMQNGHFYAIFGNGYGSLSGKAALYLVRLDDPDPVDSTKVIKLDTQTANNGMSSPLVVDTNGDRIADAIYVGDLQGHLWKVNVGSSNPAAWDFAHTAANAPAPLFTARSNTGAVQPITAKPEARKHPNGGLMLLFGTGQFFEEGDNIVNSPVVQSFYGIRDHNGQTVVGDRASGGFALEEQEIFDEIVFDPLNPSSVRIRATTARTVNPTLKKGWFMDLWLQKSGETPVALGERVIDKALLRGDRVVFTTITPTGIPCAGGGTSWLMELDAISGSRLVITPFDVNGDGLYGSDDYIATTDPDTGVTQAIPVSGIQDTALGITGGAVTVVDASNDEKKLLSGSTGETRTIGESDSGNLGRQSWQQLR